MHRIAFRLLGPLDVQADGERLTVMSARQRTVLITLLLAPNRAVSVDSMIEAVWQGNHPVTARNQIAICIAALRRTFKDRAGVDDLIVTSHPGYILSPGEHRIDVLEFEERVREARDAARRGRTAEACGLVDEALSLWRGRALHGVTGGLIEQEAARLEELRLDLLEERADLQLQLGRHRALTGELTALVQAHPLREQARAHLMLAQYRSGRRAKALEIFREGRRLLVEELGIEPGPVLQGLHELVLQDAPALTQPPADPTPSRITTVPAQLPVGAASFTGRDTELAALDRLLGDTYRSRPLAVAAISGVPGVGKTALAVHWANQVAARFPDGQLFVDLRGYDEKNEPVPPATALDRLLRALGVPGSQIPADQDDRAALYRSVLDNKRTLILLDNARSFDQIRRLLPGGGRCCVLITSRSALDDLTGDYAVLRIGLPVLRQEEATALLAEVAGAGRVTADPAAAVRLGELCDRLPLALRIAGARLASKPHWSVQSLATRLGDQRRRLDELSPGQGGVRAGFRLSYSGLPPAAARMYRRLGLLTVPDFAAWVGAAVLDTDRWQAEDLIERLVDAQLLEVVSGGRDDLPRYRFQDLLRLYARECAEAEETGADCSAAVDRAFGGWLALAQEAHRRMYGEDGTAGRGPKAGYTLPGPLVDELLGDPMEWYEAERSAIVHAVEHTARADRAAFAWSLTVSSTALFETRSYLEDWHTCAAHALDAARRCGDRLGEATMLRSLGVLAVYRREYKEAEDWLTPALALFADMGDVHGSALVQRNLAFCARFRGELELALSRCEQALAGVRAVGDAVREADVLGLLAQIELDRGNVDRGLELCTEAVARSRATDSTRGEAQNTYRLAEILLRRGEPARAEKACRDVLTLTRASGDRVGEIHALRGIGEALWRQGSADDAATVLRQALPLVEEVADRFLRARVETDLGCTEALYAPASAVDRLERARDAFGTVGAHSWQERIDRVLEALREAGPGEAVPADLLTRLLAPT